MDKKSLTIAGVVIILAGGVGGFLWSNQKENTNGPEGTQERAMATLATITIEEARKTALENFPGTVIEARLETKLNKNVWEVAIQTTEQGIMVVQVDAASGAVVTTDEQIVVTKPAEVTKS